MSLRLDSSNKKVLSELLNTPERYQQHRREAHRQALQAQLELDGSPRRRRVQDRENAPLSLPWPCQTSGNDSDADDTVFGLKTTEAEKDRATTRARIRQRCCAMVGSPRRRRTGKYLSREESGSSLRAPRSMALSTKSEHKISVAIDKQRDLGPTHEQDIQQLPRSRCNSTPSPPSRKLRSRTIPIQFALQQVDAKDHTSSPDDKPTRDNSAPMLSPSRSRPLDPTPTMPSNTINKRSVAQRARRAREAAEKSGAVLTLATLPSDNSRNTRSVAQQARRAREAAQKTRDTISDPNIVNTRNSNSESTTINKRALAQRLRRAKEAAQKASFTLPSPPTTHPNEASNPNQSVQQHTRETRDTTHITHTHPTRRLTDQNVESSAQTPANRSHNTEIDQRTEVQRTTLNPHPQQRQSTQGANSVHLQQYEDQTRNSNIPPRVATHQNRGTAPTNTRRQRTTRQQDFLAARKPYHEPPARHDLGYMNVACPFCGALHWMNEKVVESSAATPEFSGCCDRGQVRLPRIQPPPVAMKALFTSNDSQANEFRTRIRQYNSALAFTSLGVELDKSVNADGRGWVFKIHGQLCHRSGALVANPGKAPSYAQLYVYDPAAALQERMNRNDRLREDTMLLLQNTLSTCHQYAPIYKHAFEVLSDYGDVEDVSVRLRVMPGQDRRRYNLPTAEEVAFILPGNNTEADSRDIILRKRMPTDIALYRISDGHPAYAPLHYVLLFPYGDHGWHQELYMYQPDARTPKRLSQTRYVAHRLHQRNNEFSTILRGGRLFQQYVIDMWASAEQNRLNYLRMNQRKLRASVYSGLEDAINATDGNIDLGQLGQRYILPSSYTGSPRHMQQRYQDAMAIARFFGKVDLFITVTANPKWPEITRELLPGQTAFDRPDLVARVFHMKKQAILKEIYENGIFGMAVAYVWVDEFQKRGIPHMHLLVVLAEPHKLLSVTDVDSVIRATWPDPETEPLLFETVKKCMIHGPCGTLNPHSVCMENGKCTKFYPKAFQPHTTIDHDGYPLYARPDDGHSYKVGDHFIDNRFIIPHNPYLSAKYDCHINVECAATVRSIKYIFKYMHKGGDRATLQIERDEIKSFIDGRYIAAPEAVCRIFHYDTHEQIPNVVRLQVHLPGHHLVTYDPDEDPQDILARAGTERTKLTQFFVANAGSDRETARQLTYQEFPQKFVWKGANGSEHWALRRRGFALGRMVFIPPTAGEQFYLRTLLAVVKGPKSFEDLRTFEGVVHPTFHAACLARGLLEDDGEWRMCLQEASVMQTGTQLRHLFAIILLFSTPRDSLQLWNEFREHICDDLPRRLLRMGREDATEEEIYDYGLFLLNNILKESGHALSDFSLPLPLQDWNLQSDNPLIAEQLNYTREDERVNANSRISSLNADQLKAYESIMNSVREGLGKTFFLNGSGGTGKTFVYNTVAYTVRGDGQIIICVASSGISALILRGGRTAHSMFKIPIEVNENSVCSIPKEGYLAGLLRVTKIIIWDEALMHHRHTHEALDRTLRDVRDDNRPFGGVTMVFGGDFQQILPVVPKGSREDIIDATLLRSRIWNHIEVLNLRLNMRLEPGTDEEAFASWLIDIGHGRGADENGTVALPDHMRCENTSALIDTIYPNLNGLTPPPEYFLERTILAPRNENVDGLNQDILDRMSGDEQQLLSADTIVAERGVDNPTGTNEIPIEYLRSLNASGLPPGEINIKLGCPMILLRNLAPMHGLCNGTRMVVQRISGRVLEVKLLGGEHAGEVAFIPRIPLRPSSGTAEFSFVLQRLQFPARLAFAMSINKAQGQSVRHVGLYLRCPVFAHGQLYVALSRATSSHRIRVLLPDDATETRTLNIVYPEVLMD